MEKDTTTSPSTDSPNSHLFCFSSDRKFCFGS